MQVYCEVVRTSIKLVGKCSTCCFHLLWNLLIPFITRRSANVSMTIVMLFQFNCDRSHIVLLFRAIVIKTIYDKVSKKTCHVIIIVWNTPFKKGLWSPWSSKGQSVFEPCFIFIVTIAVGRAAVFPTRAENEQTEMTFAELTSASSVVTLFTELPCFWPWSVFWRQNLAWCSPFRQFQQAVSDTLLNRVLF